MTELNFDEVSFEGSGCLLLFQLGVAKYIQDNFNIKNTKFTGYSGGALVSYLLACNINAFDIYNKIFNMDYNIFNYKAFDDIISNVSSISQDKIIDINNRLTIICFNNKTLNYKYFRNFKSKKDIFNILSATCHLPLVRGILPYNYKKNYLYDPFLMKKHPQTTKNCLKVFVNYDCNKCKKNYIKPATKFPLYWAFNPPKEILNLLFKHGYYQCKKFFTNEENDINKEIIFKLKHFSNKYKNKQDKILYFSKIIISIFIFIIIYLIFLK